MSPKTARELRRYAISQMSDKSRQKTKTHMYRLLKKGWNELLNARERGVFRRTVLRNGPMEPKLREFLEQRGFNVYGTIVHE